MGRFAKMVNGFFLQTIFAKRFILDVWQGSEYASELKKQSSKIVCSIIALKGFLKIPNKTSVEDYLLYMSPYLVLSYEIFNFFQSIFGRLLLLLKARQLLSSIKETVNLKIQIQFDRFLVTCRAPSSPP